MTVNCLLVRNQVSCGSKPLRPHGTFYVTISPCLQYSPILDRNSDALTIRRTCALTPSGISSESLLDSPPCRFVGTLTRWRTHLHRLHILPNFCPSQGHCSCLCCSRLYIYVKSYSSSSSSSTGLPSLCRKRSSIGAAVTAVPSCGPVWTLIIRVHTGLMIRVHIGPIRPVWALWVQYGPGGEDRSSPITKMIYLPPG